MKIKPIIFVGSGKKHFGTQKGHLCTRFSTQGSVHSPELLSMHHMKRTLIHDGTNCKDDQENIQTTFQMAQEHGGARC